MTSGKSRMQEVHFRPGWKSVWLFFGAVSGTHRSAKCATEQADSDGRGVVYLSRIPHGFYEPQMKHFFEQFGHVTRLKLWRSKKSGKPKGFAYVEFEYEDVAKIVSETMDNYLMYRKLLKCKFIPKAELKPNAFSNAHRKFIPPYHRDASARRHNRLLTASRDHILENQRKLVLKEKKRRKKMEALGIKCNLPGYVDEWEDIQQAHAIISEKERLESLRLKEIEMKKQQVVKRAKDKVKARSKKRRVAWKLRSKAEKQQQGQVEVTAAASTSEEDELSAEMETSQRITRMSLRSMGKPRKSLEVGLKTLKRTPSKNVAVTPKSTIKKDVSSSKRTPKASVLGKKQPPETEGTPVAPSTLPPTNRKAKTPKREPASDEFEMSADFETSDSTEKEPKIPKFSGITRTEVKKKRDSRLKHPKIKIHGDQLIMF